ncbi:MAG: leucyl aminopeptidase [Lutibacter sp.]|nr:MAG: leucyl aminopeptidase [Lutibacter sp.]
MRKEYFYIKIIVFISCFSITVNAQTYDTFYGSIVDNVSSTNILNDLTTFEGLGIKEVGTTALTNTENWITARYQSLGYSDVVLQEFTYSAGTSNNIIVTKIGTTYPNTFLIIDAHYDTINGTGTNDNGSGTVLILEMARLLKDVDTEYSIKFIHFSGEEDGLIGSNYYVDNTVIPNDLDILLVFNIDEVGGVSGMTNDTIVCEQDESNPTSNNAASSTATNTLATCIGLYSNLNTEISNAYASDYIPFENNGEIITGIYEKNETPHAHTATDLLVNMDPNYVYEVTKGSLGAALHFAVSSSSLNVAQNNFATFKLFPNPTNGILNLSFDTTKLSDTSIRFYDLLGKLVYEKSNLNNHESINLQTLEKGVYFAVITNGNSRVTKKVILN